MGTAQQQQLHLNFIFWGAIVLIVATPTLGHYWYSIRKASIEASLKRKMIERGMSAEEIERVLAAGSGGAETE